MKKAYWILLFFVLSSCLYSQYYLRGEVRDEKGKLMPGVKIYIYSKGTVPFSSGSSGLFGINCSLPVDTITLSYDGYEMVKKPVITCEYQVVVMKILPAYASLMVHKLSSKTVNLNAGNNLTFSGLGESYSSLSENSFIMAARYPETGFALNIDRASYSNVRRFLMNGIVQTKPCKHSLKDWIKVNAYVSIFFVVMCYIQTGMILTQPSVIKTTMGQLLAQHRVA